MMQIVKNDTCLFSVDLDFGYLIIDRVLVHL